MTPRIPENHFYVRTQEFLLWWILFAVLSNNYIKIDWIHFLSHQIQIHLLPPSFDDDKRFVHDTALHCEGGGRAPRGQFQIGQGESNHILHQVLDLPPAPHRDDWQRHELWAAHDEIWHHDLSKAILSQQGSEFFCITFKSKTKLLKIEL